MRILGQLSGGGVEQPMIPTHPPIPAKRKIGNDENPLNHAAKRPKNEAGTKRKLQGEEQRGGLVIVRGDPRQPSSTGHVATSQHQPLPRQPEHQPAAGPSRQTSQPPTSKGANTTTSRPKGKDREIASSTPADVDVEEDVRRMDSEADSLRDRARSHAASLKPGTIQKEFAFPGLPASMTRPMSRVSHLETGTTKDKGVAKDTMLPIAEQETPQIAKNKLMRGEHPSMKRAPVPPSLSVAPERHGEPPPIASGSGSNNLGQSRRRSSISMRGKRVSATFENTGAISRPHTSVANSALYKHIDADLPESERARQLLIWTSMRAQSEVSKPSSSKSHRTDLPALPPGGADILKSVQEEVIRQLAEKLIDTSLVPPPESESPNRKKGKDNEQNLKNHVREKTFMEQIKKREAESAAWIEVTKFYNAHQANILARMDKRHRNKGKQRASSQDPEDLEPREHELPAQFRGARGFGVAKALLDQDHTSVGKGDERLKSVMYKSDRIYATMSSCHQLARIASSDLDSRFAVLSTLLAARTPTIQPPSTSNPGSLSSYLPPPPPTSIPIPIHPAPHTAGGDPQDLLRALSRVDAGRPKDRMGDAARRAAKDVLRSQDGEGGLGGGAAVERKLTGVPAPTPRKAPGTPRRGNTPGTSGKRG